MPAVRLRVSCDQGLPRENLPGDLVLGGENVLNGALATAGSGTLTAALIANGIIYRTGPSGSFNDTTDTAANILAAIVGNSPSADVVPGSTFRLLYINTVAQVMTLVAGTGITLGTGTTSNAGSLMREYLFTILSACPQQQFQMTGNSAQTNLYFGYNVGTSGAAPTPVTVIPLQGSNGPNGTAVNLLGALVTGTNVGTAAKVNGLIQGQGGIIGVSVTVANSGAVNGAVTFGPSIQIDSLGTKGL